jgi:hypothetical protein
MKSSRFLSRLARAVGLRTAVAALLVLPFVGCGGGGGGGSTPTQPSGPTQAQVTVSYTNVGWYAGLVSGFNYAIQLTITIRETAGVGIKGNFLRAELYSGANGTGTHLGTREAGGNVLGHLAGGGTETETLAIGFNAGDTASIVMTLNVTDDRGNVLTNSQTFNCCG